MNKTTTRPRETWRPDPVDAAQSALGRFAKQQGFGIDEYDSLWRWSVSQPVAFWKAVWEFSGLRGELGDAGQSGSDMFGTRFFDDAQVNIAENLLSAPTDSLAIVEAQPDGAVRRWNFGELRAEVELVASWLRSRGVDPGDVVATIAPNRFEAVVSYLACAAVGGIWTSCAPEMSEDAIVDRIGQVAPKVLFTCQEYSYNGKKYDLTMLLNGLIAALPQVEFVILIDRAPTALLLHSVGDRPKLVPYREVLERAKPFEWRRFPFNSPGLVMYTSGTTGKPKAMVHSAGGVLLRLTSEHALQISVGPGDVLFWYTNIGWMMFAWMVHALVTGSAILLYEDSAVPVSSDGADHGALWRAAAAGGVTAMGISPGYMTLLDDAGYSPKANHDLPHLSTLMAGGSPVSAELFEWAHAQVSDAVRFFTISGGTELMSLFVGGSPLHPVRAGEMSCKQLGMAVDVFDENGISVVGRKGELVCTVPFPSMPLTFWGENGDARYRAAYFERFPKVWTHGDLAEVTVSGGFMIYGRSDTTLNPGGVRIGTAEIYRPLASVTAVEAAVVFGRPIRNSEEIVLCVKLLPGLELTSNLAAEIRSVVRSKASPRHVPHAIYQVDDVPLTQNGKVIEAAAKAAATALDVTRFSSLRNPECLDQFAKLGARVAL